MGLDSIAKKGEMYYFKYRGIKKRPGE